MTGRGAAAGGAGAEGGSRPARIVACLDMKDGRVVKGVQFQDLRDQGDPVALALRHAENGADEIVLLDIAGTEDSRAATLAVVRELAPQLTIPLGVGGGIRELDHMAPLLEAGAAKVIISSAAVANPNMIPEAAARFGSRRLVVAVDAKKTESGWEVYTQGGKRPTGLDAMAWCRQAAEGGAGEILLTSIDRDGTAQGFDLPLIQAAAAATAPHGVPIIASGGAGTAAHLQDALEAGAGAVLAASIFHQDRLPLRAAKAYLQAAGISIKEPPPLPVDLTWLDSLRFDDKGLVPVVVVPAGPGGEPGGPPLMMGWSDREALSLCMTTGVLWFWSRSRRRLWMKGETSGHLHRVHRLVPDCDDDTVMAVVSGSGPVCHTGADTCFYREGRPVAVGPEGEAAGQDPAAGGAWSQELDRLYGTIQERLAQRPEGSYVVRLAEGGAPLIRRKVGEEAIEVIVAGQKDELVAEMADLWFHSLVLLAYQGIDPAAVAQELARRHRPRPSS